VYGQNNSPAVNVLLREVALREPGIPTSKHEDQEQRNTIEDESRPSHACEHLNTGCIRDHAPHRIMCRTLGEFLGSAVPANGDGSEQHLHPRQQRPSPSDNPVCEDCYPAKPCALVDVQFEVHPEDEHTEQRQHEDTGEAAMGSLRKLATAVLMTKNVASSSQSEICCLSVRLRKSVEHYGEDHDDDAPATGHASATCTQT